MMMYAEQQSRYYQQKKMCSGEAGDAGEWL